MHPSAAPDEADALGQALEVLPRVVRLLRQAAAAEGPEALSLAQYRLLRRLVRGVGLTSELASDLGVKPATVSAAIDCLVRRGFVERLSSMGDRREVPLAATPAGRATVDAAHGRQRKALSNLVQAFTPRERQALATAVAALGRAISARHDP